MRTATNFFRVSTTAPPDKVFAYVSDLTKHAEWNDGLKVEAVTPGLATVGSKYHSWGKPGNILNEIVVTEFQPPARFAFVTSQIGFSNVRHDFIFHAHGAGTLLERIVSSEMPLHIEIIWRLFIFPFSDRPSMNKSMNALKAKLDSLAV